MLTWVNFKGKGGGHMDDIYILLGKSTIVVILGIVANFMFHLWLTARNCNPSLTVKI
jgi:hypothetical protein